MHPGCGAHGSAEGGVWLLRTDEQTPVGQTALRRKCGMRDCSLRHERKCGMQACSLRHERKCGMRACSLSDTSGSAETRVVAFHGACAVYASPEVVELMPPGLVSSTAIALSCA
jgi:hypothetical protein